MKRVGLLCLAVVLAFGALGVAYAPWTDEVYITQTVATGDVSIGFSKALITILDDDKDIASAEASFVGESIGIDALGRDIYPGVDILIANAYPCIEVIEVVDIASAGSIPVHITSIDITVRRLVPGPEEDLDVLVVGGTGAPGDPLILQVWEDGVVVMNLALVNALDVQLHQGGVTALEIHKKFKQPMQQDATYVMTVKITGTQYNWP